MVRVPEKFIDKFEQKGDTFFEIAELLYANPDRQYTQDELAKKVDRSNMTISNHTREMVNAEWVNRQEDQTTFAWNSDAHNPASTEGISAVRGFYVDCWSLLKKHSNTTPGTFAMVGFSLILTAVVIFAFYLGFSLGITQDSPIPSGIYFVIAVGSFLSGVILTLLSPLQAIVNRIVFRIIPENFLNK